MPESLPTASGRRPCAYYFFALIILFTAFVITVANAPHGSRLQIVLGSVGGVMLLGLLLQTRYVITTRKARLGARGGVVRLPNL